MSSRGKEEIYTCIGVLLFILVIALYVVYVYFGLLPFIIGGFFVAVFAVYAVYNSRKTKNKPPATQPSFSAFQRTTPEEREKLLQLEGFTKYTDENGNTRWRAPNDGMPDWAKAEKVDVVLSGGSMHIEVQKETTKIRCSYCGTVYEQNLERCPNCGASRRGDEEIVPDLSSSQP